MRPTRLIASASVVFITAGLLTVPSVALAADPGDSQDRIVLEPSPPADESTDADTGGSDKAKAPAKPQVAAQPKVVDHPPVSRARVISDLREAAKCASGSGRSWVVVNGPGDIRVAGWAQCEGSTWTLDVTTGSGHVGGMTLSPQAFGGSISIPKTGAATSDVRIRLPWGASMLPKGDVSALLELAPAGSELGAEVTAVDSAKAGRIDMSGKVLANGTFVLKARGAVQFAGSSVPMSGVYRSGSNGVRGRGTEPTWSLAGSAKAIQIPGASFEQSRLTLRHDQEGIQGAGRVDITRYDITSSVQIRAVDGTSWNATLLGAKAGTRKDARLPGLTLLADRALGSISSVGGRIQWSVRMPMRLVDGKVSMSGNATIIGPDKLRLTPLVGTGDAYGVGRPVVFTEAAGSLVLEGKSSTGRLAMGHVGEQLVDMPAGWTSMSVLEMTPRFGAGPAATLKRSLQYVMVDRTSRVVLSGDLPATGSFTLGASGYLGIGNTKVPVQGRYIGAGPRQSATPGKLLITANTDRTPKRYADLGSGARAHNTTIVLATRNGTLPANRATSTAAISPRALTLPTVTVTSKTNTSSQGGTITLTVNDVNTSGSDDSIVLTGTWSYANHTYTVNVKGTGTAYWEPYDGLEIPVASISGTITKDDSTNTTTWSVSVSPAVTWKTGDGMTLTSEFKLSSTCTQDMAKSCPDKNQIPADAFFISGDSGVMNIPTTVGVTIPELEAGGAFMSTGTWARWDATVKGGKAVTVELADSSLTMEQVSVTLFTGATRDDTDLPPDLVMPDLSELTAANMNLQACGQFKVDVLDIVTTKAQGCVGITPKGKVLGQSKTGGATATGDDTGGVVAPTDGHDPDGDGGALTLDPSDPPEVNGFAYSDIDPKSTPQKKPVSVQLYNKVLPLLPKQNSLTVKIPVPGSLMESFGTGISTTTDLIGTGWFKPKTEEFNVDLDIPVNLKAAGATLQNIDLSLTRKQDTTTDPATHYYDFVLDATGEVAIQTHHYPFDAQIDLQDGKNNYAEVSLTVIGESNSQTIGGFDDTSLLAEGDFEPPNMSMFDGTFDASQPKNDFADSGFEAGTPPVNLVDNMSFEDSTSLNLLSVDGATFDGDASGNLLPNASFDDTDVLMNGDFEGADGVTGSAGDTKIIGWQIANGSDTNFSVQLVDDTGPSGQASRVAQVTNSSSKAYGDVNTGFYQQALVDAQAGGSYTVTGWLKSKASSNIKLNVTIDSPDAGSPGDLIPPQITLAPNTWTQFSYTSTPKTTGGSFHIYIAPLGGQTVLVDDVTFGPTAGNAAGSLENVASPDIITSFDSDSISDYNVSGGTTGVAIAKANGNGYLQTTGCGGWWRFKKDSVGYESGGFFDFSTTIYFPGSSGREIANVAFLMDDNGGVTAKGFVFRLQTQETDGGFYFTNGTVQNTGNGSYLGRIPGAATSTPAVSNGGTYRVRLIGTGSQVTANVTNVADNSSVYTETVGLPAGSTLSGSFGQYPDGSCTSGGQRWDDITLATRTNLSRVAWGSNARTAPGFMILSGTTSSWGYLMDSGATSPKNAQIYTYSAWLRAKDSNPISGNLVMQAVGASQQTFTQPFTVTDTWTKVTVTGRLNADANSLRVGLGQVTEPNGTLYLDDHSVQQVTWQQYAQDSTKLPTFDVVADPDPSETDKALLMTAQNSSAAGSYYFSPFSASSQYRVTAKVRAATSTPVTGAFRIYDSGTGTAAVANFTVDNSKWVTVTSTPLTSTGGTVQGRVAVEFPANSSIYIDDIVVTASEVTSSPPQSASTPGVLPNLTNWTGDETPIVVMSPNNAYDDSTYQRINYGKKVSTTMPVSAVSGQSYEATVWVKSPFTTSSSNTSAVTAKLSSYGSSSTSSLNSASATLTADGTYRPLTVVLPLTANATSLKLEVTNGASANWVAIDYVTVSLEGDTLVDPWVASGSVGMVASDDSAFAYSGHGSLRITAKGSGSLSLDDTITPTTTARSFSVWMRSATSSTSTVTLTLSQAGGSSVYKSFSVGPNWGFASVTLPVTEGTRGTFTSKISVDSAATFDIDDVITRDVSPFVPSSSNATAVVIGSASAPTDQPSATATRSAKRAPEPRCAGSPPTPTNVQASVVGSQVTVTWNISTTCNVTGYHVNASNGTSFCNPGATSGVLTGSCVVSGVAAGTYSYKVAAHDSANNVGGWSSSSNTITVAPPPQNTQALTAGASSEPNYLMVTTTGAGGVQAPTSLTTGSEPIDPGSSFTIRAHLMAAPGTKVSGSMGLKFGSVNGTAVSPQLEEGDSPNFMVDDTWTQVAATFVLNGTTSATSFTPTFSLNGAGTLFIDSVVINPVTIEQAQPWVVTPAGSNVVWGVYDDPDSAHDGTLGVLKMTNYTNQSAGLYKTATASPKQGETYSGSVWVRTADDTTAPVTVKFTATGGTTEEVTTTLTASDEWQIASLKLPIAKANHTGLQMTILSAARGVELHVDDVSIVKNAWSIDDTSTHTNLVTNPSAENDLSGWGAQNGAEIKRTDLASLDGGYGVELIGDDTTRDQYAVYALSGLKPSTTYTVSAYVWLGEYAKASDVHQSLDLMWAVDYGGAGSIVTTKPDYSRTMEWQRISVTWTTSTAPNANMRFYAPDGGGWYVDNLMVEEGRNLNAFFDGSNVPGSTLTVVGDGDNAWDGSGYARLATINAAGSKMYADAVGTMTDTQYLTAYVKSATDDTAAGSLKLSKGCTASKAFTATSEWTEVQVSCQMPGSGGSLRMEVDLTTPGGVLDVDSIRLSNESDTPIAENSVYGVTTPLEHPDYGYEYLWDDAFGIPGMHLWAFTMQVEIVNGEPGLAVETTVYQDPTKLPNALYGSLWLKSDLYLEIDELQPCFKFDFVGASGDNGSGVKIAGGAIKAQDFSIAFAPRGCAVGDYKMPPGASLLFDAQIGDGTVHFALDIEKNSKGEPTMTGDVAVKNINIGGIDYHDLEMSVYISPTDDTASYVADMTLPMGEFSGDFNMSAAIGKNASSHVDGTVELTDWGWTSKSGKGMKINVFDFDFSMDVGTNNCGTLTANAKSNAKMDFAMATNIDFTGDLAMECGLLTKLDITFDYTHGSITEDFYLKYDSSALTLAGGVDFDFDRKLSWKAWGHRYHRTANVQVYMDFLMDVTKPQDSYADLGAKIHVANGSGSAECTITGQPSDSCKLSISVNSPFIGKVGFTESW